MSAKHRLREVSTVLASVKCKVIKSKRQHRRCNGKYVALGGLDLVVNSAR
jgi:hypothetical protein